MMNTEQYYENGLNVQYIENFIEKSKADLYLEQLLKLPFYTPTFTIRGKTVKPKRQILAYGDDDVSYAFSGAEVPGESWTPLLLELRDLVEKHLGCTYNYVLLNFYPDGGSYISHHKDNESSLDMTFPIAVLSFGEKRTLEFKKTGCESTCIDLHHGSMYTMMQPTNEQFTHGIASDSSVKNARISLTFRHVLYKPKTPPLKKPRLVLDEPVKNNELSQNAWLAKLYETVNPAMLEWCLNWNTYVQIVLEKNIFARVHIRNFKERENGQRYPTKTGIVMTSATWEMFQSKIFDFHFTSASDSLIANNQLFVAYLDNDHCLFQQIFKTRSNGFYLKPDGLKLSRGQFITLRELSSQISEGLIDVMLTQVLPNLILNETNVCYEHLNVEQAKEQFLNYLTDEIRSSVDAVYKCFGCVINDPNLFRHDCMLQNMQDKFNLHRQSALLNLNIYNIAKNLSTKCTCHYSPVFFKLFGRSFYEDYFVNIFCEK